MDTQEHVTSIYEKIKEEVLKENKDFENQLQLYQPSYFNTLNSLFEMYSESEDK